MIAENIKRFAIALSANAEILEELINSEDEVYIPDRTKYFALLLNQGLIEQTDVDSFFPGSLLLDISKAVTNSRYDKGGFKDLDDWFKSIESYAREYNYAFERNDIDELQTIRRHIKQSSYSLISEYRETIKSIDADVSDTLGYSKNINQRIEENESAIERLKGIGSKIDGLSYKKMDGVSKHPEIKAILAIELIRKRRDLNGYLSTILTKTERLLFQQRKLNLQTKRLRNLSRFLESGGTVELDLIPLDFSSPFNQAKKVKINAGIIPEALGDVTELRFLDILKKIKFDKTESTRIVENPVQYLTGEDIVSEVEQFSDFNIETENAKIAFHRTIVKQASSLSDYWNEDKALQGAIPQRVWLIYMIHTYKLIQEDMKGFGDKRRLDIKYKESLNSENSCVYDVEDVTIQLMKA